MVLNKTGPLGFISFMKELYADISSLIRMDPLLETYANALERRRRRAILKELEFTDGKKELREVILNQSYYGLHRMENKDWVFREKAPRAKRIFLYGDFSAWQIEDKYELTPMGNGDWELKIPSAVLKHQMLYKLWILWEGGSDERIPAYATRVVQDETTKVFSAQVWDPPSPYIWKNSFLKRHSRHFIYEAHIGMSSEKEGISTYHDFMTTVLPRIKKLGYNTIQLMAIQEHPYYGSFGYQVANFFAPSSRFGTPEELKELIDTAHEMEIAVILDLVHSHSVSNIKEGLGLFDGHDDLYFHSGQAGVHPVWLSRCFDYGKPETVSFLLSNLKYWMEEYRFDGLRFDGITSMCYKDHGIGVNFTDYSQYFDDNVDEDAITYLTLANKLAREVHSDVTTIAEDVSGLPALAWPVNKGGIGFDYRMAMGIPDLWNRLIQKVPDENWDVGEIFFRLTDKRKEENTVSYAESHDQAMVGDKTIIFQLMDRRMYDSMGVDSSDLIVDRGMALHKLIRFLTLSLADGGYLNFMGNEFGNPEWIDFPREGNGWSYAYARRRWDLADDPALKYRFLENFDHELIAIAKSYKVLESPPLLLAQHIGDQVLAFERNGMLFVANLNPARSYTDYEIPSPPGKYRLILDSDSKRYHGFGRIDESTEYFSQYRNNAHFVKLYIPTRTCFILQPCDGIISPFKNYM